jgi:hypothetical protein
MSNRWTIKNTQLKLGQKAPVTNQQRVKFPVKKKTQESSANNLTKEAIRLLRLMGYHVWRQNNAAIWDPVKKIFRKGSATPGISDIIGFHKKTACFIAVEIKIPPDKLSDHQVEFLEAVRRAGGIGVVIRSGDDLERVYKNTK